MSVLFSAILAMTACQKGGADIVSDPSFFPLVEPVPEQDRSEPELSALWEQSGQVGGAAVQSDFSGFALFALEGQNAWGSNDTNGRFFGFSPSEMVSCGLVEVLNTDSVAFSNPLWTVERNGNENAAGDWVTFEGEFCSSVLPLGAVSFFCEGQLAEADEWTILSSGASIYLPQLICDINRSQSGSATTQVEMRLDRQW